MSNDLLMTIRCLEGRNVNLALRGGSRLDDCQLVSAGLAGRTTTLWIIDAGMDTFVPIADVLDCWEARAARRERRA